ncbi:MAG: hypothetical protein IJC70_00845 [Firmicutes bacterium]|nr:hypothetical protein [Bacillota bacterium]MBR6824766.1 hypothetical protein [Bacillota bacterium]
MKGFGTFLASMILGTAVAFLGIPELGVIASISVVGGVIVHTLSNK